VSIVDDLLDLADSTISVQSGTVDGYGVFSASGSPVSLPCRYEEGAKLVRDASSKQEVVSSVCAIVLGVLPSHDPSTLRFTLPSGRFAQSADIQATRIDPIADETGVIGAEVYFP
jgi:hypothetical protein